REQDEGDEADEETVGEELLPEQGTRVFDDHGAAPVIAEGPKDAAPPLPASPTRGEVSAGASGWVVPRTRCETLPLVGRAGEGVARDVMLRGGNGTITPSPGFPRPSAGPRSWRRR